MITPRQIDAALDAYDAEYRRQLDNYKATTPRDRRMAALLSAVETLERAHAIMRVTPRSVVLRQERELRRANGRSR